MHDSATRDFPFPARKRTPFRLLWPAWLILALALAVTAWGWKEATKSDERVLRQRFQFDVELVTDHLRRRLAAYEQVLSGGVGLFEASESVTRAEWHTFVFSQNIGNRFPGIQGVGYAEMVPPANKASLEARVREEGFPDFVIRPAGDRAMYSAIIYLEPFDWRNQRSFGYDMFSEPVQREAMERARDSGGAAISGRVTLAQETAQDVQAGFLMYLPFYRQAAPTATMEERREALLGYVYAPFRMDDFMAGILGQEERREVDLEVFDGSEPDPAVLMYDSDESRQGPEEAVEEGRERTSFILHKTISVYGRPWTIEYRPLPGFGENKRWGLPETILIMGSFISLLLFVTFYVLATRRARALELAAKMSASSRESEARLQEITASLGESVIVLDETGAVSFTNPAAEHLLGRPAAEMLGRNGHTLYHGRRSDGSPFPEKDCVPHQVVSTGRTYRGEEVIWSRSGEALPVALVSAPILRQGKTVGAVQVFHDIRYLKAAERRATENAGRLSALIASMKNGVLAEDQQRRVILANQAFCDLFAISLPPQGLVGQDCLALAEEARHAFAESQRFIERIGEIVAERKPVLAEEWIMADGRVIERDYLPVDTEGENLGHLWIYRDITGHKRLEEELKQLNENLSQRVAEEVAKNLAQERMLIQQSRMAAMGEMIGNIAHQWRQPLNALGILIANIQDAFEFHELDHEYLDKTVQDSERMIRKMSDTIDDFRNFFRPNKEKQRFNVREVLDETLNILSASLRHHNIRVETEADSKLEAFGYPNEYSQVLVNILNNAKDALIDKGVQDGLIAIRAVREEGAIRLEVRDNAGGIAEEVLPKIFDPYFTTRERGTGIGLYMSRIIVENNMGGQINVRNLDDGAEFTVTCPAATEDTVPQTTA